MKAAFQKDEVFLADVRVALQTGSRRMWWLGQSGFLLVQKGRGIILDPYLSDSLSEKYQNTDKPHVRMTERVVDPAALAALGVVDLITSSHNHTDHLDAQTLLPLLGPYPQARLILPAANRSFALQRLGASLGSVIVDLDHGKSVRVGEVEITGIASAHPTVERDAEGRCLFLGYFLSWGGLGIYHSGDTLWHPALIATMKQFKVDVALLPINGDRPERRVAGNLDGAQAARLAHEIHAGCAVPCHYDLFEFNTASTEDFVFECQRLNQNYKIVRNGEGWDIA